MMKAKKFIVNIPKIYYQPVIVEAASHREAKEKAADGKGKNFGPVQFSNIISGDRYDWRSQEINEPSMIYNDIKEYSSSHVCNYDYWPDREI